MNTTTPRFFILGVTQYYSKSSLKKKLKNPRTPQFITRLKIVYNTCYIYAQKSTVINWYNILILRWLPSRHDTEPIRTCDVGRGRQQQQQPPQQTAVMTLQCARGGNPSLVLNPTSCLVVYCRPDFYYYSLFTPSRRQRREMMPERARARLWFILRQITLSPYCASFAPMTRDSRRRRRRRRRQRQDEVPFWGLSPCFYIMLVHRYFGNPFWLFPFFIIFYPTDTYCSV